MGKAVEAAVATLLRQENATSVVDSPLRVLILGDSTYGPVVQDSRATTGYRSELERPLTWANVPHVPPMDRSVVGTRVGDLLPYVRPIIDTDHPDIVIVAFGTNDAAEPDTLTHFGER